MIGVAIARGRAGAWRAAAWAVLISTAAVNPAFAQPKTGQPAARESDSVPIPGPQGEEAQEELPFVPRWTYNSRAEVDLIYTDNVFLTPTNKVSDFIFVPTGHWGVYQQGPRSELTADVELAVDLYAKTGSLTGLRYKGLAYGYLTDADNEWLTAQGRVATDLQQSSQDDRYPAIERSFGINQVQVLSYGGGPVVRERLTDRIQAEALYDLAGVNFLDPPRGRKTLGASSSWRHLVQGRVYDAPGGDPASWEGFAYIEQKDAHRGSRRTRRGGVEGNGTYAVSGHFAVTGRAGYDWFDQATSSTNFDGLYAMTGFQWRPTPRTSVRAEAGYRYREPSFNVEVSFRRREWLNVTARYLEDLQTAQRLFYSNLQDIAGGDVDFGIDPDTGFPLNPNALFAISDVAFQRERASVGIDGRIGRTFYSINGFDEKRTADNAEANARGAEAVLGRDFSTRFTASVSARYDRSTNPRLLIAPPVRSKTKKGAVQATYRMNETLKSTVKLIHLRRKAQFADYRENVAYLGVVKSF